MQIQAQQDAATRQRPPHSALDTVRVSNTVLEKRSAGAQLGLHINACSVAERAIMSPAQAGSQSGGEVYGQFSVESSAGFRYPPTQIKEKRKETIRK
jgi:hypothetical protein